MRGALWVCCFAGILAGCATPKLTLVPGEDGHTGAVAVLNQDGSETGTVIDKPNSHAILKPSGARLKSVGAGGVPRRHRELLAQLPNKPAGPYVLYFYEGTTKLTPQSQPALDAIVAIASPDNWPGAEVEVTGHTDTLGSDEDNDRLSMNRAQEILGVLVGAGVAPELLTAVGRGERQLLEKTADGIRNAPNRRVEVIIR